MNKIDENQKSIINRTEKVEEIYLSDSDSDNEDISEVPNKNMNQSITQNLNHSQTPNNNNINNIINNNNSIKNENINNWANSNSNINNNNNANNNLSSKFTIVKNENEINQKEEFGEEKNEVISIHDDSDSNNENENDNNNSNENKEKNINEFSNYFYNPDEKNEWGNVPLYVPPKNNNITSEQKKENNNSQINQESTPQSHQKANKKKKKSKSPEIDINNDSSPKYYPIWMNKLSRCTKGLTKLHYEILDYVSSKLIPNKASEVLLKQTALLLEKEIKKISQYFDILPYGSYVQKLNTVNSDLDFTLIFKEDFNIQNFFSDEDEINNYNSNKKTGENYIGDLLDFLKRRLINSGFTEEKDIEVISGARVPILKCKCAKTNIKIDLSLCRIQSVKLAYKIRKIAEKEILIRYTTILLKEILRNKNLDEVFQGGMSSILLFEMVCFFFQRYYNEYLVDLNNNEDKIKNNITSLGHFFFKFLEYYSTIFDYRESKINLQKGGGIIKEKYWKTDAELNVIDVTNDDNNLGKYCFEYDKIKRLFNKMYLFIRNSPINTIQSYLYPYINKKDMDVVVTDEE